MTSTQAERAAQLAVIERAVASTYAGNPNTPHNRERTERIADAVHMALINAGLLPAPEAAKR